jgi:hypothetical protein
MPIDEHELNKAIQVAQKFIQIAKPNKNTLQQEPTIYNRRQQDKHDRKHRIHCASMELTKALEKLRISMRAY